jgi:ribosome recycling factor
VFKKTRIVHIAKRPIGVANHVFKQDEIQKITDKSVTEIDKMLQVKETDLMAV